MIEGTTLKAVKGVPIEVPAELASRLLEQSIWEEGSTVGKSGPVRHAFTFHQSYIEVNDNYAIDAANDGIILASGAQLDYGGTPSGAYDDSLTITLPEASACPGQRFRVKVKPGNGRWPVRVAAYSGMVYAGYTLTTPGASLEVISDGANWHDLGDAPGPGG